MKNTKGFTLIELLAVIVILAIIALIATPMILGVIDSAKKGAAESSAYGYLESVEKSSLKNIVDKLSEKTLTDGVYTVNDKGNLAGPDTATTEFTVSFKGDSPAKDDKLRVENGEIVVANFHINGYSVNYDGKTAKVVKSDSDFTAIQK